MTKKATLRSWGKIIGISTLLLYLIACSIPYRWLEFALFQGNKLDKNHQFEFSGTFESHDIKVDSNIDLHIIHFKATGAKKGSILYCHGNADHLQRWGQYHPDLTARGYDVWMYDYRGYGLSEGTTTSENFYSDGQKVFDWLKFKLPKEELTIYGRSLGTAVASRIASRNEVKALLLETPFDNVQHLFKAKIPILIQPLPFKSTIGVQENLINNNDYPIHIFQGDKDRITPPNCADHLKKYLKSTDSFYSIKGGKHKNLSTFPAFQKALDEVLGEKLEPK